ncbi:glycosyltransferase family 2 protein, partial [Enterococcus faecium]
FTDYKDIVETSVRNISLNHFIKKILLSPFLLKPNIHSPFIKKLILSFGDPIGCPTVTYNSSMLKKFSFSHDYSCILDWAAWYAIASQKGSFYYINKSLMLHRIHTASETSNLIKNGIRKKEEADF